MRPPEGSRAGMDGAVTRGWQLAGVLDRRSGAMCSDWRGGGGWGRAGLPLDLSEFFKKPLFCGGARTTRAEFDLEIPFVNR